MHAILRALTSFSTGDDPWMERAACAPGSATLNITRADRDDFAVPEPLRGELARAAVRRALATCAHCAVRAECLAFAERTGDRHSVLGGLTPLQRRTRRRALNRAAHTDPRLTEMGATDAGSPPVLAATR